LPRADGDFIGREHHLAEITEVLLGEPTSEAGRYAVPIVGISGRGGVGKSALALRAAHELAASYPDGHLYVDLQGAAGKEQGRAVLARLLRALGADRSTIPDDPAERAELYRSWLAGRRLLLVLDDVASEQQVMPLLPGSPTCAVLLTSRTRLSGLSGAHWIEVDGFDRDTSVELLERIVGGARLRAEPVAAAEVVGYCDGLPLALRIAGARLASRPHWRIAELARRLRDEARRLDEFSHRGLDLRSNLERGYHRLPAQAQLLFRRLALVEAEAVPGWVAAALLDVSLADGEEMFEHLVDVRLLDTGTCGSAGRYLDGLTRAYAMELLERTETAEDRDRAVARVLGGWLHLAERAHRCEYGGDYAILHGTAPRWRAPEPAGVVPEGGPMDWLEAERPALVAAVRQAAAAGMDELCWDLALTLVSMFEVRGYLDDWQETTELAYRAATLAGNRTGIAGMRYSLGNLRLAEGRLDEAEGHLSAAQEMFRSDGHLHGQALALRSMAMVEWLLGNVDGMLTRCHEALAMLRAVGDVIGEAQVLRAMAAVGTDDGDTQAAEALLSDALALCRRAGDLRGPATG
jgi:hypothetical protein